ncbi:single-stranded DNA-binding protein [Candidatus Tisiphia endosymbiont of Nemotelus uliginosus]|uniref:single-stranded DNA-binding protein n=1 Tax=Candidatus Tisiphia endosymbiont of Nemotelus uliginosus TaxID=3077926 RepID=UPI0035C886EF
MASSLNKATLIGNLGRDPEIRHTNDGKEIASFSVATSETWKDRATGEKKEKTEWHRVVVFNEGLVSVIKNYAKKGTKVYLEGSIHTRKWLDNSGQEKYTTEIVLQNFNSQFILLDSKGSGSSMSEGTPQKNAVNNFDHSDLDDEIPF